MGNPEYFLAIARLGSISKAAEELFLSQPYLSQCLARLERELGARLFDRSHAPLELTEAGKCYQSYLQSMKLLDKRLEQQLDDLDAGRGNTLHIGCAIWRGSVLLPDILPAFSGEYPDVSVMLHEYPSNELLEMLRRDEIDFAVLHAPPDTSGLTYETIFHERILLAAYRDHPLVRDIPSAIEQPAKADIRLFANERFILLQPTQIVGQAVDNLFRKYGISPARSVITNSSTTALNLVSENFGFTFVPEAGIRRAGNLDKLKFFSVDEPTLTIPLSILYKRESFISPAARAFMELTKAHYARGGH